MRALDTPTPIQSSATPPHVNRFHVQRMAGTMPVWSPKADAVGFAEGGATPPKISTSDGPTFKDFMDVINPLQHIPVVSTIYRRLTGDEISPQAQFAGGLVYGGPIGGALAMASIVASDHMGKDMRTTITGMSGDDSAGDSGFIRKADPVRMSGSNPVWSINEDVPQTASNTQFTKVLNGLSADTPNIS